MPCPRCTSPATARQPKTTALGYQIFRCAACRRRFNEQHLRVVLAEFVAYYDTERPHRSLRLDTPQPTARRAVGSVYSRPVLGGLHRVYERAG